jgi:general L-amino acid transport system permease protein
VGLLHWIVAQANWLVITRNLRVFMVGLFPAEALWRVNAAALLCTFAAGYSIYAYLRLSRRTLTLALGTLALMLIVPPLTGWLAPPAAAYVLAGSVPVQSGTVTEEPQQRLAFIGRAGESVRVTFALQASSDAGLTALHGFADRATAGLYNAARNRFAAEGEITALDQVLAGDLLTDAQRAALTEDRAALVVPPPLSETYAVNAQPVHLALLDGATLTPLAETVLDPADALDEQPPVFSFTLSADGWYVLEKRIASAEDAVAVLRTEGIYPVLERNLTGRDEYVRITDDYTVVNGRPEADGRELPFVSLVDNAYRGEKTFADFMGLYAAPMLALLMRGLLPLSAAGVLGGLAAWGIVRARPQTPKSQAATAAARTGVYPLWAAVLVGAMLLLYGVEALSPLGVGVLLASFVWVGWMVFAGVALDQPWGRPLLGLLFVLLTGMQAAGHNGQAGIDLAGTALAVLVWGLVGIWAARQGAAARERIRGWALLQGVVISGALWLAALALPVLLAGVLSLPTADVLPVVETRRWGGLLLTTVLTAVALLASFPIGIALALGRRSSLPVVRGACTVYIELVRGVPLITVLFMAQLLVPLIDPQLANVENVIRAIVGLTLFSAAYLAENVRGGLQSLPHGQEEAARALGLSGLQITLLITLPQALRAVIPALVGQCIALFKDTSLVALVGLFDLTGIAKAVTAQAEFVGLQTEAYVFISVMYFIFSYVMAFVSRRIEASGSGVVRRFG